MRRTRDKPGYDLSERDKLVLTLMGRGMSALDISMIIGRSESTIQPIQAKMRLVTGTKNNVELIAYAIHRGLITTDQIFEESVVVKMVRPPAQYDNKQYQ